MSVGDLVELLDASEATIRRDISALADRGELRRVRGGAEALRPRHYAASHRRPVLGQCGVCVAESGLSPARRPALSRPATAIIINAGTTTWRLVEFFKDVELDILTNSFPIAADLLAHVALRITVPGGTIYREQNIILCPFEGDAIEHFAARSAFLPAPTASALPAGWRPTRSSSRASASF